MNQYNEKGEPDGYWERYFINEKLSTKGTYINGKRHGYWEYYFRNGKFHWRGSFNNDQLIGYWEWYDIDDKIEKKEFYL